MNPQCVSPSVTPQTLSPPVPKNERKKTHRKQRSKDKLEHKQLKEKEENMKDKRLRVVRELLESEKAHVHALGIVIERYLRPLTQSDIIEFSTIRAIFSNLELIRNWNQTFLAALEAHLECGDTFGDLFMEMVRAHFKIKNTLHFFNFCSCSCFYFINNTPFTIFKIHFINYYYYYYN